jgi:DnaJ family protein C protein 3
MFIFLLQSLVVVCFVALSSLTFLPSIVSGSEGAETVNIGKLRLAADEAFTSNDFDKSLALWAKVIAAEPQSEENYYKRFRVHLKKHDYRKAVSDLTAALEINPKMEKALSQRGKYNIKLGFCADAEKDFVQLKKLNPSSKELYQLEDAKMCRHAMSEADKAISRNAQEQARDHLTQAIRHADQSTALLLKRAQSYFASGYFLEAISDAGKALKHESGNIPALELRGRSYYMIGEFESALNHFRTALKSDPEHKSCKDFHKIIKKAQGYISKADGLRVKKDYDGQIKELQSLMKLDNTHKLLALRAKLDIANAYRGQKKFKEAKALVSEVLASNDGVIKAHLLLGYVLLDLEEWDAAVATGKKAAELAQNMQGVEGFDINLFSTPSLDSLGSADELVRKAEAGLKQSKQKDFYKILGVSRQATEREIKKAYHKLALQWHPDKHNTEEEKEIATKKFELIAEAHEVLSNEETRRKYDMGEEVFPNQGGGGGGGGGFQHHGFPGGFPFGGGGQQFHFKFG